jgi:NAD(P)-dependent dehydrogenase (short-subunit alcohol dehydrogenase family)
MPVIFTAMPVVIVTGASGNLGKAVVSIFSQKGWQVIAFVSSRTNRNVFKGLPGIKVIRIDALKEKPVQRAVERCIKKYGKIHAAVLTIGGFRGGGLFHTTAQDIDEMMRLNFFTAWHFVRPLMNYMCQQGSGRLILIGSAIIKKKKECTLALAYCLAKATVAWLADLLQQAGKPYGVKCVLMLPSTLDTPQNRQAMPSADFSRWQKPEKLARTIYRLVSR